MAVRGQSFITYLRCLIRSTIPVQSIASIRAKGRSKTGAAQASVTREVSVATASAPGTESTMYGAS